jgi:hypothetical protein
MIGDLFERLFHGKSPDTTFILTAREKSGGEWLGEIKGFHSAGTIRLNYKEKFPSQSACFVSLEECAAEIVKAGGFAKYLKSLAEPATTTATARRKRAQKLDRR